MSVLGFESLSVLLVLLPGFLCAGIVRSLCTEDKQTQFDRIVEALLYSFVIYAVDATILRSNNIALRVEGTGEVKRYLLETPWKGLLGTVGVSIALGLSIGAMKTNDLHGRLFRKLRITQRTSRNSVWSDVFHKLSGYALVELLDGRLVAGWLRYYSDTPTEESLFLEDAAWIERNGNQIKIDGPGILITKNSGIRTVAFVKGEIKAPTDYLLSKTQDSKRKANVIPLSKNLGDPHSLKGTQSSASMD